MIKYVEKVMNIKSNSCQIIYIHYCIVNGVENEYFSMQVMMNENFFTTGDVYEVEDLSFVIPYCR